MRSDWLCCCCAAVPVLSVCVRVCVQLEVEVIPEDPVYLDAGREYSVSSVTASPSYLTQMAAVIANVKGQMAADRKTSALKQLQGGRSHSHTHNHTCTHTQSHRSASALPVLCRLPHWRELTDRPAASMCPPVAPARQVTSGPPGTLRASCGARCTRTLTAA